MHEEITEQQADITRLLLHHIQVPLTGTQSIRSVLAAPAPAFVDCWTEFGLNIDFTADDRHRAVHLRDTARECHESGVCFPEGVT